MIMRNILNLELERGWKTAWDRENRSRESGWMNAIPGDAPDAVFPGYIADTIPAFSRGVGWFWNRFSLDFLPDETQESCIRVGYAEPIAEYWLNGVYLGKYESVSQHDELDVTGILKKENNLLAIRIISPTQEGIEGYYLNRETEENHPINNIVNRRVLASTPFGGVLYPVRLASRARLRCGDIVIDQNWQTGAARITAKLVNHTGKPCDALVSLNMTSPSGECVWFGEQTVAAAEEGSITFDALVQGHKLWSPDEPNLYRAQLSVRGEETLYQQTVDFGFRDFRVINGYFHLNGKRMFLKSCNYSNVYSIDDEGHWNVKDGYRDIVYLKALGYNMFRFLTNNPYPEFIDMCDRAGALILEEHGASWGMSDENPDIAPQMEKHIRGVLRRDRNHPSVVGFGVLNEILPGAVLDHAKTLLPMIRREDPNRLIFFNSGKFDLDMGMGSVSNPGSMEWNHEFGGEHPGGEILGDIRDLYERIGVNNPSVGDVHIYPDIPVKWEDVMRVRNHGRGYKPSMVTEGNIGSFGNQSAIVRRAQQKRGIDTLPRASEAAAFRRAARFEKDFYLFGLDDVYASPNDLSYWACHANAVQKRLYNTMIRSNPQFASMNPGLVDGGHGNNVVDPSRTCTRPFLADVYMETMAKLTWCLFINPTNAFAGEEVMIEAVLASEDVLLPGTYPVAARIVSPEVGCIWEYRTELTVPEVSAGEMQSFAFPVFREFVKFDVPEGTYDLTVWMEKGAEPAGGRLSFTVTARPEPVPVSAAVIGLSDGTKAWLSAQGVAEDASAKLVLVGKADKDTLDALYRRAEYGADVVFLDASVFVDPAEDAFDNRRHVPVRLPFENRGYLTYSEMWYYHPIQVLRRHPFTEELPKGILHDDFWGGVTPQFVFDGQEIPDELCGVTLAVPYLTSYAEGDGYLMGTCLAAYKYGRGRLILNGFKITENLGRHPAADRLMRNILKSCGE